MGRDVTRQLGRKGRPARRATAVGNIGKTRAQLAEQPAMLSYGAIVSWTALNSS
ncbi:MAG: hypothetical protein QOC89_1074 [Paraburkholderia sp.]|nr:hypothetical protein [Paraburkholderia sp.]